MVIIITHSSFHRIVGPKSKWTWTTIPMTLMDPFFFSILVSTNEPSSTSPAGGGPSVVDPRDNRRHCAIKQTHPRTTGFGAACYQNTTLWSLRRTPPHSLKFLRCLCEEPVRAHILVGFYFAAADHCGRWCRLAATASWVVRRLARLAR